MILDEVQQKDGLEPGHMWSKADRRCVATGLVRLLAA